MDTNMVQKDGADVMPPKKKNDLKILVIVLAVLGGGLVLTFVVGILAAIAVPNFVKARASSQRNACIDNMRQIEGAIEQVLMEGEDTPKSVADLCGPGKYIKTEPKCPSNKNSASYIITTDSENDFRVICPNVGKFPDHALPTYGNW